MDNVNPQWQNTVAEVKICGSNYIWQIKSKNYEVGRF